MQLHPYDTYVRFFITQYQRSTTALLLCSMLLLQGCRSQLATVGEEPGMYHEKMGAQQEDTSDFLMITPPPSPPTIQSTASFAFPSPQERSSPVTLVTLPPLRTTNTNTQQDASLLRDLLAPQTQEDRKPPAKRQRITKDTPAPPAILKTDKSAEPTLLYEVFISHAAEDMQTVAIPLYEELKRLNIYSFVDRKKLRAGKYVSETMTQAMNTARCGVFILSPEFASQKQHMEELRYFMRRYREEKDKGNTPPLLVPIFHRLTRQHCKMTPGEFWKTYKKHFTTRRNDGLEYPKSVLKDLIQLESFTGVERQKSKRNYPVIYQLIVDAAQKIHKEVREAWPTCPQSSEASVSRLHNYTIHAKETPHYTNRPQEIAKIREILKQQDVCVLCGDDGNGKSTLAHHYAHNEAQSVQQQFKWFVSCTSPDNIWAAFQDIAQKLGIDCRALIEAWKPDLCKYCQELSRQVYGALEKNGQCLFLVLDDAGLDNSELIKGFISQKYVHNFKIIITTNDPTAFSDYEKVTLSGFLLEEAIAYVTQRLKHIQGHFANSDTQALAAAARQLVEVVGHTPLELDLAMGFLQQNKLYTIAHYAKASQSFKEATYIQPRLNAIPEVDMALATLDKLQQQVMYYSTNLNASFMPWSLLEALLEKSEDELLEILKPLERLSLVNILTGEKGISINQSVQSNCQTYGNWDTGTCFGEAASLSRLVEVLCSVMPWVEVSPDARWEIGRLYAPHVSRVLAVAPGVLGGHASVAYLLGLMGNYQEKVIGDYQQACIYFEQALVVRKKLYGKMPHPDIATSLHNVGMAYYRLGNVQKTATYLEQALTMRQKLYGKVLHPDVATSLHNMGVAYGNQGDTQKSLAHLEKALTMRHKLYGEVPHPDTAASLHLVGIAYETLDDVQESLNHQEQALAMYQQLYGEVPHLDVATSLNNVGVAYERLGNVQKGLTYKERALTMLQELYGKAPHPHVAASLNDVGEAHEMLGEAQQSLTYKKNALTMLQKLYGKAPHPYMARCLSNVGGAYQAIGEVKQGIICKESALTMLQELYGEKPHPEVATSLNNVGETYERLGELQKGLSYKKQALTMCQALYGETPHPDTAISLDNVGGSYQMLGDIQKGLDYQERALTMRECLYGKEPHVDIARSLNNMGVAYYKLKEKQKCFSYQKRALTIFQALYGKEPHIELARSLDSVGVAYQAIGKMQKGLAYLKQALTMRQRLYGATPHPEVATSLNNVGVAYEGLGGTKKGLNYKMQALVILQNLYGEVPNPSLANTLNNVGIAYQKLGVVQKSITYQKKALTMLQSLYGQKSHPDVASTLNNVGMAYQKLGDTQKAKQYFEKGLAVSKKLDAAIATSYTQAFMQKLEALHDL